MNISDKCLHMIRHHEGVRQNPYKCPAKLWTVGVGHVMFPEQGKLKIDDRDAFQPPAEAMRKYSMEEVDAILAGDLARFERGVTQYCGELTQSKFEALVSFAFNLGLGTLQRSTLRQKVLRGEIEEAADEFLKFTRGGGKILPGLVKRRNDERALFLSSKKK